jgi:hypothetical protein
MTTAYDIEHPMSNYVGVKPLMEYPPLLDNWISNYNKYIVLFILVELLTITVKEAIVRFVDTGGIVDHHCLEGIVCFVDTGGFVDHHC